MSTIREVQQEIIEEFEDFPDWMDRYAYIIELGNQLAEYAEDSGESDRGLSESCMDSRRAGVRWSDRLSRRLGCADREGNSGSLDASV